MSPDQKISESTSQQRLRVLREAFAEQLPNRVRHIEEAWETLLQSERSPEELRSLGYKVRSLASSSAIFGFDLLAEAARELELLLQSSGAGPPAPEGEDVARIGSSLEDLKRACVKSSRGELEGAMAPILELPLDQQRGSRVILVLTDEAELSANMGFELGCFGFLVRRMTTPAELRAALEKISPAAVVVDAEPLEQRLPAVSAVNEYRRDKDLSLPLFVLASRTDLDSRLASVRAGGDAYFVKPLESRKLIERLDLATQPISGPPFRILIVEESYQTGLEHSLTLQRSGMETCLVTQPAEVWEALVDFKPDLLLIGLSGSSADGFDIAAVVRQDDAYANIPIVFLSQEGSVKRQIRAMRSAANDLLVTPINEELLISVIGNHVQRARTLGRFIATDSLTGLLNHSKLLENLVLEVDRAERNRSHLVFALLDIDHLKAVNEAFGHLSGDSVLRSLARLVLQRLRRTDVIGRFGDDEFAIVMPETSGENAVRVLNGIRELYSEIRHFSGSQVFYPAFSCGVAALPGYASSEDLRRAAASALSAAKRRGGNRVVLAEE